MAANSGNIDVITDTRGVDVPNCPHGPTLLFTRYDQSTKSQRQFFACSAFRDRKDCPFFQWRDVKIKALKEAQSECVSGSWPSVSHKQMRKRMKTFKKMKKTERTLCVTCGLLLLPADTASHESQGHVMKTSITKAMLTRPTQLFAPLENNKTYAQYLFSETTVDFILSALAKLDVTHVLCVGCPRIHEAIQLKMRRARCMATSVSMNTPSTVINDTPSTFTSLLLDLDQRYLQVYPPSKFCRYNMLNHHFFGGPSDQQIFNDFVKKHDGKKVAMVLDPPFGVMTEVLAVTISKIQNTWRRNETGLDDGGESVVTVVDNDEDASEMPVLWFFPYFMERRVVDTNKGFTMLDYKVDYDNHALFKGDCRKKGSPVRIFTNMHPKSVPHPLTDGYWFCDKCDRYSATENRHCDKCNCCPTKDGYTYKHCDKCARCVKPSRAHCDTCGVCNLPQHKCGQTRTTGCHICGEVGHKRRECPNKDSGAININLGGQKRKAKPHFTSITKKRKK